ncbi:hypothetical protein FQN50_002226 [Emmonsiellopsis sp. PD_5]|nr:hypothetical protein FQN50_002226 [Emmonsiellopsis sp. PD_5]
MEPPGNQQEIPPVPIDNPFDALITACANDPIQIQANYATHRSARNSQQKAKILDPSFEGWSLDSTLAKLEGPERDPNFIDPRHNITLWARPPPPIRQLIASIQSKLQKVAPSVWFMPLDRLHMTALEVVHSVTEPEMETMVASIGNGISEVLGYTLQHRSHLIKPMISYDTAGLALSFVPAVEETTNCRDQYTYHHLRRDIFALMNKLGAKVGSRYVVPSAHITIARFITQDGFLREGEGQLDPKRVEMFMDEVNVPKTRRTYCKSKECRKHTQHKVTQYKAGKASTFAQGKRRYDRKQSGYGGQTKPVFHKKAKTTKKVVLRLECTACKTKAQLALKRCKHFELGGDKKTKGAALVF